MIKIGKRGEIITLSILILAIIIGAIYYYQGKVENTNYIGDSNTKVVYNIKTKNPSCDIQNIKIETNNLKLFETLAETEQQGYHLDNNCN